MRTLVVIPTLNGRESLAAALQSLEPLPADTTVVVVDNASEDGTAEMVAERFPLAKVKRNEQNDGFGKPLNAVVLDPAYEADVVVLLNNDVICSPGFLDQITAPFADERVGMVAGVLTQKAAPELVDSAGIELDTTLKSWDLGWNGRTSDLGGRTPVGPCGGAAAYRLQVFRDAGGFDDELFAYWEDVDIAIRIREAGWDCVLATGALAEHRHGGTVGATSPWMRTLDSFGRGYLLGKYRMARRPLGIVQRLLLDWPMLVYHLLRYRELEPLRARRNGIRTGLAKPERTPPLQLATVSFGQALGRRFEFVRARLRGHLPAHFEER